MANKMNSTKVVTGVVRLSYANVWEPASINGSNPKYSVSLIIPKSDKQTLDAINAAVDAAIKEGVAKFGGKIPNKAALKLPLRDGDTERDDEAYKNSFFVNANSTTAPQIVDRSVQPILDRSEVYSGVYGRASINLYAFNSNGNKGIACGLNNLQLIRPGEPLGDKASAEAVLATSRRFVMVSLSVASPLRLTISPPTWTTTSCPEKGVQHNGTDSEHPGNRPPWHLGLPQHRLLRLVGAGHQQ